MEWFQKDNISKNRIAYLLFYCHFGVIRYSVFIGDFSSLYKVYCFVLSQFNHCCGDFYITINKKKHRDECVYHVYIHAYIHIYKDVKREESKGRGDWISKKNFWKAMLSWYLMYDFFFEIALFITTLFFWRSYISLREKYLLPGFQSAGFLKKHCCLYVDYFY